MNTPRRLVQRVEVMELHHLAGLGVLDAKRYLESMSEVQALRLMQHVRAGKPLSFLVDPVEFDPEIGPKPREAEFLADEELRDEPRRMGFCHLYWRTMQRILHERFSIK